MIRGGSENQNRVYIRYDYSGKVDSGLTLKWTLIAESIKDYLGLVDIYEIEKGLVFGEDLQTRKVQIPKLIACL